MKSTESDNSGVSEVVGVMIMITVTLILAGFVLISANSVTSTHEKPISSTVTATEIKDYDIIFDNVYGEPFTLDRIGISMSISERPIQSIMLSGSDSSLFQSYSGDGIIVLGGRFKLLSEYDDKTGWGEFVLNSGEHLDYSVYDMKTNTLISTGRIAGK